MNTRIQSALFMMMATLFLGSAIWAESYSIDPTHSHIVFSARHMGLSSVRGEFTEYSANFEVDEDDLTKSSIVLEIDASSIDTQNENRDNHLRSPDFLDVANHPQIVFASKDLKDLGEGRFEAVGDLTIRGVTKQVTLDLQVGGPIEDSGGNMRIGVEGEVTIDRQDYDVNFSKIMDNGGLLVGNDVKIDFALEAVHKADGSG